MQVRRNCAWPGCGTEFIVGSLTCFCGACHTLVLGQYKCSVIEFFTKSRDTLKAPRYRFVYRYEFNQEAQGLAEHATAVAVIVTNMKSRRMAADVLDSGVPDECILIVVPNADPRLLSRFSLVRDRVRISTSQREGYMRLRMFLEAHWTDVSGQHNINA